MSETTHSGHTRKLDTVRLQKLSRAFIESASLFSAIDLGLFTAIDEGSNTPQMFATYAGISELNASRLMTMCAGSGLIARVVDHYENAEDVQRYLVKGEESYAGAWMTFPRPTWTKWGNLTEELKNTAAPARIGNYDTLTVAEARSYHQATASIGFGSGRRFVKQVDLSRRKKIMDLGGGSGAYSIVAAKAHPQLSAVVLDLPPVVEVTQEFIDLHNVENRVSTQGGDFTQDEYPGDCDVAILASNLPQYNADIIALVINKAFAALVPGGEMHLIGEMLDDDRNGPLDAAMWGLMEALFNSTGSAHTRADCVAYFEQAGFVNIEVHEFIPGVLVRVCGSKPN